METIEQKLERLTEYHAQRDMIELKKRALMDEVKVPDEVLEVQNRANDAAQKYAAAQQRKIDELRAECAAKLAEIEVPPEVADVLKMIDHRRGMVRVFQEQREKELRDAIEAKRGELFESARHETAQVYADLAVRKEEINAEFANKERDADLNIATLEKEIKSDVIARAAEKIAADIEADDLSVKGGMYHAVYSRGRVTWKAESLDKVIKHLAAITREIDAFVAIQDDLAHIRKMVSEAAEAMMKARKEGDPSVALRKQ